MVYRSGMLTRPGKSEDKAETEVEIFYLPRGDIGLDDLTSLI